MKRKKQIRDDFGQLPSKRRGLQPYITVKVNDAQRAIVQRIARDLGGLSVSDAVRFMIHTFTGKCLDFKLRVRPVK